ncbi:DgyrCDS731 [Dimorphilus gyrociliatus]|uniref:DgyrCDS731 n=1 Tax=Dimorphilus gyrociliatus TaxID=2664684 RepID=A0A7I8VA24_9ANNE|nr:DgyrCDS731 [Dimorphilus gyrociliatus]
MSYCREEGKDKIVFLEKDSAVKNDSKTMSLLPSDLEDEPGLVLENGEINWNCPCLGGMSSGPCGVPFREAFSCFHYSQADQKGSDCYEEFAKMTDCFRKYPDIYAEPDGNKEENDTEESTPDASSEQTSDETSATSDGKKS